MTNAGCSLLIGLLASLLVAGCNSGNHEVAAPNVAITFPPPVSAIASDAASVFGTSAPEGATREIRVNGVKATTSDDYAHWQVRVPLAAGRNEIIVSTVSSDGTVTNSARATIFQGSMLGAPSGVALDTLRNRVLVVDSARATVVSMDLATSLTSDVIALPRRPSSLFAGQIAVDSAHNRALALVVPTAVVSLDLSNDSVRTGWDALQLYTDIVIDPAGTRAYLVLGYDPIEFPFGNKVLIIDPESGQQTVLSGPAIPDTQNPFVSAAGIALDAAQGRLLVTDRSTQWVVGVDASTGARSVLSGPAIPDADSPLQSPRSIVVDVARNRALVADAGRAIVSVDLATGRRTTFSNDTTPDIAHPFLSLGFLVMDPSRQRLLVTDRDQRALVAVDLASGARSIVAADAGLPRAATPLIELRAVAVDGAYNRLLVADGQQRSVFAIDLDTGARTILSGPSIPDANEPFSYPYGIAIDAANDRALVLSSPGVIAVDRRTGARTVFLSFAGLALNPSDLALDAAHGRVLVLDRAQPALVAVDLASRNTTVLSGPDRPNANNAFAAPVSVALDMRRNRALVVDQALQQVIAVDLTSGDRTVLATSPAAAGLMSQIAVDVRATRAVVADSLLGSLFSIDLASGALTTLSDRAVPPGVDKWRSPMAVAQHPTREYWLVGDQDGTVYAVHPENGRRVVFSR